MRRLSGNWKTISQRPNGEITGVKFHQTLEQAKRKVAQTRKILRISNPNSIVVYYKKA